MVRATNLSKAVGFQQHVNAILEDFKKEYVWADKEKSSLAIFLVDALAGISEVGQTHTMFALREAFLRKARRNSSILANVKFLGVELSRKSGSATLANLRNNSDTSIPVGAFTQFSIGGRNFYNSQGFVIDAKSNKSVVLKQGTVAEKNFNLANYDLTFPEIYLGVPNFIVSSEDLQVRVIESNGVSTLWTKHTDTLYEMRPTSNSYIESTTENGDVSFLFGNGTYGRKLSPDATLNVRYIINEGAVGNIGSPGSRVTVNTIGAISGVTEEAAVGGSDQIDSNFYKLYGSNLFESRGTLIRQAHWDALQSSYPDIADLVVQGQRELAPDDPSWMTTVRLCVLPKNSSSWGGSNPNPQSAQWSRFLSYVQARCGKLTLVPHNPEKILIDVLVDVYIFDDQDASLMEATLTEVVKKFFSRRTGILGRKFVPSSDLGDSIKYEADGSKREGIDYITILQPDRPITPDSKVAYVTPRSIKVRVKYTQRKRDA